MKERSPEGKFVISLQSDASDLIQRGPKHIILPMGLSHHIFKVLEPLKGSAYEAPLTETNPN